MPNLYITSTAKKIGKTFVTSGIAATMQSLGYSTSVYKPIQTSGIELNGFMQSPDLTFVKSIDPYINTHFSYLFKEETEPLLAAELNNEFIDIEMILSDYKKIASTSECTLLDGDCGILSPIAPNLSTIDLIKKLMVPLLIVTNPSEDSINDTLMTISTAQEKGIDVRGVVINGIEDDYKPYLLKSIPRIIEEYTNVKVLGLLPKLKQKYLPEDLITSILNGIDIESVFNIRIEKLDLD